MGRLHSVQFNKVHLLLFTAVCLCLVTVFTYAAVQVYYMVDNDPDLDTGNQFAEDALGGLLNLKSHDSNGYIIGEFTIEDDPETGTGAVAKGLIWAESFGWVKLNPEPGDESWEGVSILDCNNIPIGKFEGKGWSDLVGWVHFGEYEDTLGDVVEGSGVYIDEEGYLHGVAWSESWGAFTFGDYMGDEDSLYSSTYENSSNKEEYWARTEWEPSASIIKQVQTPIFDTTFSSIWDTVEYESDTLPEGKDLEVRVRTGNSANLSDAPNFGVCFPITSGQDISSNLCVNDRDRYFQYELRLVEENISANCEI